jgi:hypothetical protein
VEETDGVGRGLVTVGVVVLIGLIGLLAFLAGRDDPGDAVRRSDERFPETSATAAPIATAESTVVTTSTADTTTSTAATAATTATTTTSVVPTASIGAVVPSVAAFEQLLATPADAQAQIDQLLVAGRHDVAVPGPVRTVCAIVPLDSPLQAGGRWERDGQEVATSAATARVPPGFGDCLSDAGEVLPNGSYQFIATDGDGTESAAGGLVIGAERVEQRFVNDGDERLCALRIAPESSGYFEVYLYETAPIAPGASVTLPVADVDQDLEVVACGTGEVVASFDFQPRADEAQDLVP